MPTFGVRDVEGAYGKVVPGVAPPRGSLGNYDVYNWLQLVKVQSLSKADVDVAVNVSQPGGLGRSQMEDRLCDIV